MVLQFSRTQFPIGKCSLPLEISRFQARDLQSDDQPPSRIRMILAVTFLLARGQHTIIGLPCYR